MLFATLLLLAVPDHYVALPAELVRCYDGDTCTFDIQIQRSHPIGFGTTVETKLVLRRNIRVCDVDAPELRDAKGPAARDWIVQYMAKKTITLQVQHKKHCVSNACEKTSFNRVLARIVANGVDVGTEMLKAGIAKLSPKRC